MNQEEALKILTERFAYHCGRYPVLCRELYIGYVKKHYSQLEALGKIINKLEIFTSMEENFFRQELNSYRDN